MPLFLPQPDSGFVYYFRQYFGFCCILTAGVLLYFGYDSDIMTDTELMAIVVLISVVGLIFHELRPFKRWENIEAEVQRRQEAEDHEHQD